MSSPNLLKMYKWLVTDGTMTIPPGVMRRIWRAANEAGDEALVLTLMGRTDAPRDLVEQFASVSSARARAVYLARPELSATEVADVLARETRVTVLAALAASEATPPAAFAALVEQMRARGSQQLAKALLRSKHIPSRLLLDVLAHVDKTFGPFGYSVKADVEKAAMRLEDEDANTAILSLGWRIYAPLVMRVGLSTEARVHAVRDFVTDISLGTTTQLWGSPSPTGVIPEMLGLEDLQLEVMTALDDLLGNAGVKIGGDLVAHYRSALLHASGGLVGGDLAPHARPARREVLAQANDPATDPAVLATLARQSVTDDDVALSAVLAANPGTPAPDAASLVPALESKSTIEAAYRAQSGVPGRDEVRFALLAQHPSLLVGATPAGRGDTVYVARLSDFDDPAAAAVDLCARYGEEAVAVAVAGTLNHGSFALTALRELAVAPVAAPGDPAAHLPWQHVRDTAASGYLHIGADKVAVDRLMALQVEVLRDDETSWSVFEQFEADFTGTLGGLFTAVAGVSAAHGAHLAAVS